jgi:hypothetical protein
MKRGFSMLTTIIDFTDNGHRKYAMVPAIFASGFS